MAVYKKERYTRVVLDLDHHFPSLPNPHHLWQIMDNWNRLSSSFPSINLTQSASKFAKGIQVNVQVAKERLGQVGQDELTELPPGRRLTFRSVDRLLIDTCSCRVQRA